MGYSFPILSFEQANPQLAATKMIGANKEQQIRNQYLGPSLAEALQQAKLNNQILAPKAEHAEDFAQAELRENLAKALLEEQQGQWYGPEAQSRIGLQNAQAGREREETKFIPLDYLIKGTQVTNTGNRFGPGYQMVKMLNGMTKAERDQWIAQNQAAYTSGLNDLGNEMLNQQQNKGNDILSQQLQKYFPGSDQSMAIQPNQIPQLAAGLNSIAPGSAKIVTQGQNAYPTQGPLPLLNQKPSSPASFASSPEEVNQLQNIAQFSANDSMLTPLQKKRRDSAITMESWLIPNREKYVPKINKAIQYAGLSGMTKREADEWLNQNPDAIAAYDWYNNQFAPNLANQIKMMEQMGATDQQRAELNGMIKVINNPKSNPQRAKAAVNNFISTMQDISDAVISGSEPVNKGITRQLYGIDRLKGNYTDLDNNTQNISRGTVPAGRVVVIDKDGNKHTVPKSQVELAKKKGYKVL